MIDIAIIGGGVSGLWTLHRLRHLGYDAHLFEKYALGTGQTIASQGIIHGGMKYAIDGITRPHTSALSGMPTRWLNCLGGEGEADLRTTRVLCEHQILNFNNSVVGNIATKLMAGQVTPTADGEYELDEPVLDVKSLLDNLQALNSEYIYQGEPPKHKLLISTAGLGNESIWINTQRRPLRMIMVRGVPHKEFTHYVGTSSKPLATVTTHALGYELVWYIGGEVAEQAINESDPLKFAKRHMEKVMPQTAWSNRRWAFHDVIRAEASNAFSLPSRPTIRTDGNMCVAWPAKLAFAPVLADEIVEWVLTKDVAPTRSYSLALPKPPIAKYPWETADWILQ
jgi:hypothetical protein